MAMLATSATAFISKNDFISPTGVLGISLRSTQVRSLAVPKNAAAGEKASPSRQQKKRSRNGRGTTDSSSDHQGPWRVFKVELEVEDDPGKDDVGVSDNLVKAVEKKLRLEEGDLAAGDLAVVKKSFDARGARRGRGAPKFVYAVDVDVA
eukprot:CAMPEP_0206383602 /NCGR_PEP_ID=MMETSP0294-20121207/14051_1 /ASSEMBLY_ACC=CAM_ASM_000327 /TAXON_ID=39354 /ORGANISM="Heterosigma akashiwo, Strain CCMP2393" /LENGTH=149 /DNA_ID=CAMNT_0053833701 /DNA_START=124 /DNA_END=569 /DNA_ORIENTATION=-